MLVMAGIVAPVGVFDLDHFGAEIGQRLRAGRAGNDPGEIDDQQTIQGSRLSLCARRSLRQLRLGGHLRHFPLLFCLAKRRFSPRLQGFLTGTGGVTPNPDFAGRDLPPT